jgi:hypothetical protein
VFPVVKEVFFPLGRHQKKASLSGLCEVVVVRKPKVSSAKRDSSLMLGMTQDRRESVVIVIRKIRLIRLIRVENLS